MKRPDPRQFDLFAAPPAPISRQIDAIEASPAVSTEAPGDWPRERAAIEAAIAANAPEVLRWGKEKGSAFFEICLLPDAGRWRLRTAFSMPNMGSGGPYSAPDYATREEALIAALRKELRSIATHLATNLHSSVNYGSETQWRALARWCVEQAPGAMFGGPDLAAEFATLEAEAKARQERRAAALRAVHDVQEKGRAIVLAAGVYGFPDLIHDTSVIEAAGACADPVAHAAKWPATWSVVGHAPDRLAIRVYPRHGHASNEVVARTIEALRAGLDVPVDVASEGDVLPRYPADRWTWDE